jgi:hypothetical protein
MGFGSAAVNREMCVKSFAPVNSAVSFKLRYRAVTTLPPPGARAKKILEDLGRVAVRVASHEVL